MQLTWENQKFVWRGTYESRHLPKRAGFRWDPVERYWWTRDATCAGALTEYADELALEQLDKARERLAASRATDTDVELEIECPPGRSPYPFQRAGIAWLINTPRAILGDEMGLGKTVQVILAARTLGLQRNVVVCPASLRLNWQREIERWWPGSEVAVAEGSKLDVPREGWVVVNYDVLARHNDVLRNWQPAVLVLDEAHYVKNRKAQRSRAAAALAKGIDRVWALTGTPVPNRPIELYNLLRILESDIARSWTYYVERYCAGYHDEWGWEVGGASNLEELQTRLRSTVMIRRRKAEVLTELPPKIRQVVPLPENGATDAVRREIQACERYREALREARTKRAQSRSNDEEYRAQLAALDEDVKRAFSELSTARRELGVAKVPAVVEAVRAGAEDHKVVVWAHHTEVIDALMDALNDLGAVELSGRTSLSDRQAAVDRFQNDPECRVFVGSITAAGVGITLTASSHVVFAELDWVPGNLVQAEDRCHRITQTEAVLVQYLVYDGTLDARIAHTLVYKLDIVQKALDTTTDLDELALIGELQDAPEVTTSSP